MRTRVLVREVMNSPVITANPEDTIKSVSEKMTLAGVGSVVLVENDLPIGIVTEGDIVAKVVSKDLQPSSAKSRDVMSAPLRTIESEEEIITAARQMAKYKVKRLGVTYKRNLVGIISISDVVAVTPELFDIISEKRVMMTGEDARQPSFLAGYCDQCNQWSDALLEIDNRFVCEECRTDRESQTGEDEVPQQESGTFEE